jgi:hypothetical protein
MVATAAKKAPVPAGLAAVATLTEQYADAHHELAARVRRLNEEFRQAKKRHLAAIIRLAGVCKEKHANLEAALEENKPLFVKPKTRTLHGITVGFRKRIGTLEWEDDAMVVALIKRHFDAARQRVLIKTTEKPVADALAQLSATEVKKLGVTVGEDTDVVVIKASDSDVDKLVEGLMKEAGSTAG